MGRKKNPENVNKPPKVPTMTEEELTFLASMGPTFAEGVKRIKACDGEVAAAKEAYKTAKKKQRDIFRKLRKSARIAVEA